MSEVFEGYERQYCEISAALSRKCAAASALDGGTYARLSLAQNPRFPVAPMPWSDDPLLLFPLPPEKKKQKLSEIQADVQESESLVKTG